MQEQGLVARPKKRFKSMTLSDLDQRAAANLLNRESTAQAPNSRSMHVDWSVRMIRTAKDVHSAERRRDAHRED